MCATVSRETPADAPANADEPVSRETDDSAPSTPRSVPGRIMLAVLMAPLRFYRRFISPALPDRCKYYPTCSTYAVQSLRELGPFKGTIVAAWRVLRCNPLSSGGLDPLENRRLFRSETPESAPDRAGATV